MGEFSDFSTEYETEYEADLEYNGVKGHYEQNVVYEYNFEEKKWTSFVGGYSISLTDANVSGVWSGNDCVDNVDGTENMTFVLDIKSLTPQSANGTFTVSNATGQTYSSKWSGTVTFENGCLYVTGTLSNPRNMFFGIGRDSFNFTYYIMDGTVTVTDDYFGTLERQ